MSDSSVTERIARAVRAVLPSGVHVETTAAGDNAVVVDVGTASFVAVWIGNGWLGDVREALASSEADVLVAKRMSPGARAAVADAGLGYVDEAGAAEFAAAGLVVSRTAATAPTSRPRSRWTRSVIGIAEALLTGVEPTVADASRETGLSTGAATKALAFLTQLGLLEADADRGRYSGRRVADAHKLLDAYAEAAADRAPTLALRVGLGGSDLLDELARLGRRWDGDALAWAATGVGAASVLGPYLSEVNALEVYVDAPTPATLDAVAERAELPPMEGGRLLLRPFPTAVTPRLSRVAGDLRVVPWPRAFVDLRAGGVRGEEAAEHLMEVMSRG